MAVNDKGYIDASPKPRAEGHKFTHQATQAGTGGSLPDFGGREPAKAPPSVLDNWLTLEGMLSTPREYWEGLLHVGAISRVPSRREIVDEWRRSSSPFMQALRMLATPGTTREEFLSTSFSHPTLGAITGPVDSRIFMPLTTTMALSIPWIRRSVRIRCSSGPFVSGSGYIVGPRHVLTCAHLLPFVMNQSSGATPAGQTPLVEPDVVDGSIDLSKVPATSDFGQWNARVDLLYGWAVGNSSIQTTNWSYPVEAVQVPYPPIPPNFYQFDNLALGDLAILIMPESFRVVTEGFEFPHMGGSGDPPMKVPGIGWDNVVLNPKWEDTAYIRTGWGTTDHPLNLNSALEQPPPPSPYGPWGTTARTEFGTFFDEARFFEASGANKFAGTIYRSSTADPTRGDSGSCVLTVPGASPPGVPSGVTAVFVGNNPLWQWNQTSTGQLQSVRTNRNYYPGGWALFLLWFQARTKFL